MSQRKLILFIAASLDGFIATQEHSLDWLFAVDGESDNGISKFYDTIDTILIGRTTYEWVMNHENGDFPYKDKECFVFSRSKQDNTAFVTFTCDEAASLVETLRVKGGKHIWLVGGGELLHTFIQERLVDEIIITIAPALLGRGIPLFKGNEFQTLLSLRGIERYNQFVELHYEVVQR